MTELADFNLQFIADIQGDADALGLVTVEAFFEKIGDLLSEAGEIESANRAFYEGLYSRGPAQIDGYGGDPRENEGILSLILCDFTLDRDIRLLHKDHVQRLSQKLFRFLNASLDDQFRKKLEETSPGFGVADLIKATWNSVEKVKLIIATNGDYRARADATSFDVIDDKPITLSVWDIKRLKRFMEQGLVRADSVINFKDDFGGGIPILKASGGSDALESYLAVIPGKQLAEIYDKWGPRLLEANVRSFLQVRGKVNKGIRDTIRDEPHMFFSYNNGLSATADNIEIDKTDSGYQLVSVNNLQIVNGGQTTASLYAASKALKEQIQQVFVQMKLTITPKECAEEVVPRISEYANSQNKVNAADFFANHPFHIRIEELSRRILAPSGTDSYRETKWFYERARGQFADERSRRTQTERKKFDSEYPRSQFFVKTDLAKYENTWACLPHIVSLGAQKNFSEFAKKIGKNWGTEGTAFNDIWFKRLIAKAIIFRTTEKLVSNAEWYEGGYRANIVTYAIAKLVNDAKSLGMVIDLDLIWKIQSVPEDLKASIFLSGELAQKVITTPPEGIKNYSEWAKKLLCWQMLAESKLPLSDGFRRGIISSEFADENVREVNAEKALDNSINVEVEVYNLGAKFWSDAKNWAKERGMLTPRENSIIEICAAIPRKMPSSKQCGIAFEALKKLQAEGFHA
ncbi:AIPR family protein [Vibrio cholerae]|uniref:AIPR family protein n=1 Tax=Vibrio cholerae TaxID=666 RepID=UPI000E0A4EB8|nr:AIPR family protein [Vibrio cholerae]EGQ9834872.1 AIPR family protein [Vibrio cholerae]EJL6468579.1 AIPR family protein [Vibrio cholerae]EJL6715490.1 AIPR family protein [Vibrio cholerae]EKF9632785.1 AIPR family protein [Vibrio cholerae]